MVATFQVIDTMRQHFDKSDKGPEMTNFLLCMVDLGEAPMRVMPRYRLDPEQGEVEKFSGGQLNGKTVKIEIREMSGKGNPIVRGKMLGVVNGANGK